jgi:GntR family phosphonate transport system transcriptional regulator
VTPREAASITAIAREVRAEIYAGKWEPGGKMPTRVDLADRKKVSAESIGVVMRMLASEGLVSLEQGRGTYVLPRRRYRAEIGVPAAGGRQAEKHRKGAAGRFLAAASAEPAASAADALYTPGAALTASLTIETGGPAQAVTLALGIARAAIGGGEDSREAWDLDGASVRAEPVRDGGEPA